MQPLPGLGEHLTTDHARMDAILKGYTKGQPDITLLRKLPNGFHDVLAIELKNAKYINESGLYCFIFGSKMEEAKVFKHWVTREVLPTIRKTGSYSTYRYSRNKSELGTTKQERWKKST